MHHPLRGALEGISILEFRVRFGKEQLGPLTRQDPERPYGKIVVSDPPSSYAASNGTLLRLRSVIRASRARFRAEKSQLRHGGEEGLARARKRSAEPPEFWQERKARPLPAKHRQPQQVVPPRG